MSTHGAAQIAAFEFSDHRDILPQIVAMKLHFRRRSVRHRLPAAGESSSRRRREAGRSFSVSNRAMAFGSSFTRMAINRSASSTVDASRQASRC